MERLIIREIILNWVKKFFLAVKVIKHAPWYDVPLVFISNEIKLGSRSPVIWHWIFFQIFKDDLLNIILKWLKFKVFSNDEFGRPAEFWKYFWIENLGVNANVNFVENCENDYLNHCFFISHHFAVFEKENTNFVQIIASR